MTQIPGIEQHNDPEGSFFLPQTIRGVENYKLALLLGRGVAIGKTPAEQAAEYEIADHELGLLREKVAVEMLLVALGLEI